MTCCDGAEGAGGGTGSDVVTVPVSGIVVASGVVSELVVVAAMLLVAEVLLPGVSVVLEEGVGLSLLVSPCAARECQRHCSEKRQDKIAGVH